MIKRRSESLYIRIQCEANSPWVVNLAGCSMVVVGGGRTKFKTYTMESLGVLSSVRQEKDCKVQKGTLLDV